MAQELAKLQRIFETKRGSPGEEASSSSTSSSSGGLRSTAEGERTGGFTEEGAGVGGVEGGEGLSVPLPDDLEPNLEKLLGALEQQDSASTAEMREQLKEQLQWLRAQKEKAAAGAAAGAD